MASISLKAVSIDFPIYGVSTRSLKKRLLRFGTGGKLNSPEHQIVTVKALDNIDLEIEHGDRVGLIGHNGSGKSTLLRTIAKIYEPTSGICHIGGKVTALLDVMLGMDSESTGYENIILRGILNGLTRKQIEKKKQDIADFTDLGGYLSLPVRTYSTGMQLRLAFAIATAVLPEVLVLDEVVGTGDAAFKEKAKMRFDQMVKDSHIVVLATHDLELMDKFCNKALWLNAGRVELFGDAQDVMKKYRDVIIK
jgi:lipopolysaccharide transport system ATP-binding protein